MSLVVEFREKITYFWSLRVRFSSIFQLFILVAISGNAIVRSMIDFRTSLSNVGPFSVLQINRPSVTIIWHSTLVVSV